MDRKPTKTTKTQQEKPAWNAMELVHSRGEAGMEKTLQSVLNVERKFLLDASMMPGFALHAICDNIENTAAVASGKRSKPRF